MQLIIVALLLLLAAPVQAQTMPTHPPIDPVVPTGEIPAATRSAVSARMLEQAKRGLPAAAKEKAEAHLQRNKLADEKRPE